MKVTVLVRPKDGILDPQGEAIQHALDTLGYPIGQVRQGKVFDLEVDVETREQAETVAREAAERALANGVMERFEVVVA